jgi:hypothetical protein
MSKISVWFDYPTGMSVAFFGIQLIDRIHHADGADYLPGNCGPDWAPRSHPALCDVLCKNGCTRISDYFHS